MSDGPAIVKPIPRRPFELNFTSATPENSSPPTPAPDRNSNALEPSLSGTETPGTFSRTRSIMNLTSSTLFGIYSDGGATTPYGTGAQTPLPTKQQYDLDVNPNQLAGRMDGALRRRRSIQHVPRMSGPGYVFSLALRSTLLFALGMGYGLLVTHLHDDRQLAPIQVEGLLKPSYDWKYMILWGMAGLASGNLLPWIDGFWEEDTTNSEPEDNGKDHTNAANEDELTATSSLGTEWNPVVRSIGAFVGIAFAIRKLPWTSTLQVSLTLALVNPVLWFLVDRSRTGFLLSATVALIGTIFALGVGPVMPSPASPLSQHVNNDTDHLASATIIGGLVNTETIEYGTWVASVLFCSCVCFGNIGRRLSLRGSAPRVGRDSFK